MQNGRHPRLELCQHRAHQPRRRVQGVLRSQQNGPAVAGFTPLAAARWPAEGRPHRRGRLPVAVANVVQAWNHGHDSRKPGQRRPAGPPRRPPAPVLTAVAAPQPAQPSKRLVRLPESTSRLPGRWRRVPGAESAKPRSPRRRRPAPVWTAAAAPQPARPAPQQRPGGPIRHRS